MALTMLPTEIRDRLADAELTYPEVGGTAGDLPDGYRHLTRHVLIGHGRQLFVEASDAVQEWRVQIGAGLRVSASSRTTEPGTVVILRLVIGPLKLNAPCRVVYAVNEPRRRGFAYGTLAGHPESGEESFMVEHHIDDRVGFTITAFSRPATQLAKITGPVGRTVQRRITNRYLGALSVL